MQRKSFTTAGGIAVERGIVARAYSPADNALAEMLDRKRGVLFSSSFEFPGRYTRWDMGFVDPPLMLIGRGRDFTIEALNPRGQVLMPAMLTSTSGSTVRSATIWSSNSSRCNCGCRVRTTSATWCCTCPTRS
jgi:anthranilate synthase